MSRYDRELSAAQRAVAAAVHVCRAVHARLDDLRAITKDDRSPVTVADFASQAVVAQLLAEDFPTIPLVAEEDSRFLRDPAHNAHLEATVDAVRTVWPAADGPRVLNAIDLGGREPGPGRFWTLDPVDGTKGFLRRQQYAVSLALLERSRPVVGVLGCPNLSPDPSVSPENADADGSLASAIAGEGAFSFDMGAPSEATRRPIRCRHPGSGEPVTVCSSVEESHTNQDAVRRVVGPLNAPVQKLRVDSQCKYLLVARGQADLYFRLPTKAGYVERIWDHAAGALIATEAGCLVSDARGEPLDFSHGRGLERNRGIVCAPPALHRRVIEILGTVGP